jgi:hypothetical protein
MSEPPHNPVRRRRPTLLAALKAALLGDAAERIIKLFPEALRSFA